MVVLLHKVHPDMRAVDLDDRAE